MQKRRMGLVLLLALALILVACGGSVAVSEPAASLDPATATAQDLAAYLDQEGQLPAYYLTKDQARDLGWDAQAGNLWDVAPGAAIGGDPFYNREGLLPPDQYFEADLAYAGGHRGPHRLVYALGGPYYVTADHYGSFQEVTP